MLLYWFSRSLYFVLNLYEKYMYNFLILQGMSTMLTLPTWWQRVVNNIDNRTYNTKPC